MKFLKHLSDPIGAFVLLVFAIVLLFLAIVYSEKKIEALEIELDRVNTELAVYKRFVGELPDE